jgi:acetylornithine deacetylase/succinyl-diaminopimelate desuccinylase-like protein
MTFEAWIAEQTQVEEAAALTAQLVAIRSFPGEEGEVQRAVAAWLQAQGLQAGLQDTAEHALPHDKPAAPLARPNVISRVENGEGPVLLFNGHVDTVLPVQGWSGDPWTGWRDGNRLYGLGACDMKSGVAATMLATRALARRRDLWRGTVIFSSVVDEEAYSIGARALLATGLHADACVVTEASWDEPALGSVGKVLVRADVTGKAGHASWPATSINAMTEASKFVARLAELPLGEHPRLGATQCPLSFHSGSRQYVMTVPETATLSINRHIVPGETGASVVKQMEALAHSLNSPASFAFSIDPPYYPPWETSPEHPLVGQFSRAYEAEVGRPPHFGYRGFGDANLFSADLSIPTIQFGPHGSNFHQANEWVDVTTIAGTARVLVRLALDFLNPT